MLIVLLGHLPHQHLGRHHHHRRYHHLECRVHLGYHPLHHLRYWHLLALHRDELTKPLVERAIGDSVIHCGNWVVRLLQRVRQLVVVTV